MYVFDEYPIVVSRELAKAIGLNEAIVLQQLHYWVIQNKKNNINFYDGHYWTFNSIRSWIETDFVFFSEKTLRRTFDKLEKMNLLLVGNYNKDPRNQTKWYTINEAALEEYSKEIKHSQEVQNTSIKVGENAFGQNDQMEVVKMTECNWSDRPNAIGQNDQMYIDKEYLSKNTIKEYQSINPDWDKDKIIDFFKNNLEYEYFFKSDPRFAEELLGIANVVTEYLSTQFPIKINGQYISRNNLCNHFSKLSLTHIYYFQNCLEKTKKEIKNIKSYIFVSLYNAINTTNTYYRHKANLSNNSKEPLVLSVPDYLEKESVQTTPIQEETLQQFEEMLKKLNGQKIEDYDLSNE